MQRVKTDNVLRLLIGVLLLALVYVIYGAIHERVIGVGDSAPAFSITSDTGRAISNSNFGGKLLVLNFWATWCPPCVQEMPSLNQFARDFAPSGVVVLAVSVDKDEKVYKAFLARLNPAFLTARDPEMNVNSEFGTFKYPETYVIDRQGKVMQKVISNADWTDERMTTFIKSLL